MEHIVTGCYDCLFCKYDDWMSLEYTHPAMDNISSKDCDIPINQQEKAPDWCPLNKEPISIIKK